VNFVFNIFVYIVLHELYLFKKINEKLQVAQDYEAGSGIVNSCIIEKMEKVLCEYCNICKLIINGSLKCFSNIPVAAIHFNIVYSDN